MFLNLRTKFVGKNNCFEKVEKLPGRKSMSRLGRSAIQERSEAGQCQSCHCHCLHPQSLHQVDHKWMGGHADTQLSRVSKGREIKII